MRVSTYDMATRQSRRRRFNNNPPGQVSFDKWLQTRKLNCFCDLRDQVYGLFVINQFIVMRQSCRKPSATTSTTQQFKLQVIVHLNGLGVGGRLDQTNTCSSMSTCVRSTRIRSFCAHQPITYIFMSVIGWLVLLYFPCTSHWLCLSIILQAQLFLFRCPQEVN